MTVLRSLTSMLTRARLAFAGGLVGISLGVAGAIVAQPAQTISVFEMQELATQALLSGDLPMAEALAQALVARDGSDPVGRGILARLALTAGDPAAAKAQAVALWSQSDDPAVRYDAARLAAFAWVEMDWPSIGQLWLRRALTVAPDEEARAQTIADFRAVRAANPLTIGLSFSLSPSVNVTGGTNVDKIFVNGDPLVLPPEFIDSPDPLILGPSPLDRAYSGIAYAPSLSLGYRLHDHSTSASNLWGVVQYRGVILSNRAKRALEDLPPGYGQITEKQFSFGQILAGYDYTWRLDHSDVSLATHAGRSWQRGKPAENIVNLGSTYTHYIGQYAAANVGFAREWRFDVEGEDAVEIRHTLRVGHIQMLQSGGRLRLDMGLTQARSAENAGDFNRLSVDLSYRPQDVIAGITLEGRLGYQRTHYPNYAFFDPVEGGRNDERISLGIDAQFPRFDYAGFSPVLSLERNRTFSNINQFETDELIFNIDFDSSF